MSQFDHLKQSGLAICRDNLTGFNHARAVMNHLVSLRVVKCDSCDEPAVTIFWQDQAEYYFRCHNHNIGGEQWTGSTRSNPNDIGVTAIPDLARAWYEALAEEEKALYTLEEFDATNYYALIPTGQYLNSETHTISGEKGVSFCHVFAYLYSLTGGGYAYQIQQEWARSAHTYGIIGIFDTADDAFQAAKESWEKR